MLFALIHLLAGTVLSGVLVTAVLATPALSEQGAVAIPVAVAVGAVLAAPVAWFVAKAIKGQAANRPSA